MCTLWAFEEIILSICRTVANTCGAYVNFNNINSTKGGFDCFAATFRHLK